MIISKENKKRLMREYEKSKILIAEKVWEDYSREYERIYCNKPFKTKQKKVIIKFAVEKTFNFLMEL